MDQSPIRDARPEDFDRLLAIDRAAFPPALAYSRRELAAWMGGRGCRTLVAEEAGEVVGFVLACLARRGLAHLVTLDVAPERQRGGLGGRLLAAAEEMLWAAGARAIELETPVGEAGARAFYERHGYRVLRRLPRYYRRALDAWAMVKERV
ncbi:MAG TPA: GNAT family N-acetyltransferase [Thermoanaerobaculia bacterium]|nr:GNAT family N-acetyltransferase [Thermoanaerobaculia bacterium]